jgi:hypothetical protein
VVDHEWQIASTLPTENSSAPACFVPSATTAAKQSAEPHSAENIQNRSQRAELTQ